MAKVGTLDVRRFLHRLGSVRPVAQWKKYKVDLQHRLL